MVAPPVAEGAAAAADPETAAVARTLEEAPDTDPADPLTDPDMLVMLIEVLATDVELVVMEAFIADIVEVITDVEFGIMEPTADIELEADVVITLMLAVPPPMVL